MLNFLDEELCFIIIHSQRKIAAVFHKTQKKDHNLKVMALILIRQLMFKQIASI